MSLALLFHYLMLNMFWMLIHPSSGACNLFVESNTTHELTQQISHKLLSMDVLTSKTCWALNNEIIKQVTSSWSIFIRLLLCIQCWDFWWWTVYLSETCRVLYQNKFEKWCISWAFIIRIYLDAQSYECQKTTKFRIKPRNIILPCK